MTATLENSLQLAKDKYTDYAVSQTHDRDSLYGMIPLSGKKFDGEKIVGLLVTGYPASGGARGPSATVPIPTQTTLLRHRFAPTFQWHSIEIQHDLQKKTAAGGPASWMAAIALQVDRVSKFTKKSLGRQAAGDGSGILAQIAASSGISGNTITMTSRYDMVNFELGMRIDVIDVNNDSATSQLTGLSGEGDYPVIQGIDATNKTITLDKAPTGAANSDYIISYGALNLGTGSDDTTTNEMYGLDAIVSASAPEFLPNNGVTSERQGTFQGIDPNEQGLWQAQTVSAAADNFLAPGILQNAILQVQVFGGDGSEKLNCLYCHHLQYEKFSDADQFGKKLSTDSGTSIVRYPSQDGSFTVGGNRKGQQSETQSIMYDQTAIKRSRYLKRDRAYYCNPMSAQRYELQPMTFWTDMEGKTFHKSFDNNTSYRAEMVYIGAIATEQRNSSVLISNLSTSGFEV